MALSRRCFLKITGAVFAIPAILRAPLTQTQQINMEIKRIGSQPSSKGPADWFTGTVRIDPLFQANAPARAAGASVTFEPGARTAWHTHPLGQTLIVTAGCGWVQREGGPIEEIHPGDVICVPAGREALAWCCADHGHDAHRHSGSSSTARSSTGWKRSATNNTASDRSRTRWRIHRAMRTKADRR